MHLVKIYGESTWNKNILLNYISVSLPGEDVKRKAQTCKKVRSVFEWALRLKDTGFFLQEESSLSVSQSSLVQRSSINASVWVAEMKFRRSTKKNHNWQRFLSVHSPAIVDKEGTNKQKTRTKVYDILFHNSSPNDGDMSCSSNYCTPFEI